MNRQMLFLLLIALLAAGGLVALYFELRTEPVDLIAARWAAAGHADRSSESFIHWDEDDPPLVPVACAKCHSTYGHLDYLGEDGTAPGVVDGDAKTGSVVFCVTCHNASAHAMTRVAFPSGAELEGLGPEASCMQCHQGRASTDRVDQAIAGLPLDQVSDGLGFTNVHYLVAAATKAGAQARGAYQYEGQAYAGVYGHTPGLRDCHDCHDPHSLRIEPDACSPCHANVVDYGDLRAIRTSESDADGDGDTAEGIAAEIDALHEALYRGIQEYGAQVIGTPILYAAGQFPYFFVDTDGDGEVDEGEATFANRYTTWTPRLVRTAYNYHYVHADPGCFAHNPSYVLQSLHDSLGDLAEHVSVDMHGMVRPTAE
ncbi:MAG: polyheme membrane-associated cytochrome C [Anaerolineae bacterium]|nr:polyheme membrane-associated cytochrome C [Anaerolineae bacterium]